MKKLLMIAVFAPQFIFALSRGLPDQSRYIIPGDNSFHEVGGPSQATKGAWRVTPESGKKGALSYGPYWTDLATGNYRVSFALSIDDNVSKNDSVLAIDVYSTGSKPIVSRIIKRKDFTQRNYPQIFSIDFMNSGYQPLEFRVIYNGNATVEHYFTEVKQIPFAKVTDKLQMVFNDQFNGTKLDSTKWYPCYYWDEDYDLGGCSNNDELQWYMPDDVLIGGGRALLRAERRSITPQNETKSYSYTSGLISTHDRFEFKYGFAEARMRLPAGKGFWPAFWMISRQPTGEIDIMENLGHKINEVYLTYHQGVKSPTQKHFQKKYTGPDFSNGFHTFAVEWDPSRLIYYVDGVERFRVNQVTPDVPMHLLVNLAVGGSWPGSPNGNTLFPNDAEVDYVKVWQK